VSHAMLYIGNGQVIEAVQGGVVVRSLQSALSDASLAVAYRSTDMDVGQALVTMAAGVLPAAMRGSRFPKHYDAW